MRFCPKCEDYYADDLLVFCPADGMPLAGVVPHGERWEECLRVVEEKEKALRIQRRSLRWRRAWQVLTTVMMTSMVVCIMTVNGLIYLTPDAPVEASPADPSRPTPKQAATPSTVISRLRALLPDVVVTTRTEPLPTTETTADPKPTATTTSSVTPTRGDDTPTPTPTPTPITGDLAPPPPSTPTPTPPPPPTPTPRTIGSPTPTPTPIIVWNTSPAPPLAECSADDKDREWDAIKRAYGGDWQRTINGEQEKIRAKYKLDGAFSVEASLGEINYQRLFFKACTTASITARYTWQVTSNVNGTLKTVPVTKTKWFGCVKFGGAWRCS